MTLDDHARRGLKAIEEERFDDAIEAFREALALGPDRPDLNNALGMAYLHRGDAGNAIPHLERACELAEPFEAPEHQALKQEFHLSLATAYQVMDRVRDAAGRLNQLVERWPDLLPGRLQLAQLYLESGQIDAGVKIYQNTMEMLDEEQRKAANALLGSIAAFQSSNQSASVFLQAHAESYIQYFDEVAAAQAEQGWIAEAAHMAAGEDGEPRPVIPDGARPYAMRREDLVHPEQNTVSGVYSDREPMVVALNGLEPLAQVRILFSWDETAPFDLLVSSRSPWHWLPITVAFRDAGDRDTLIDRLDDVIGSWYLAGFNGDFGDRDQGRFHYVTDPDTVGDRGLSYVVDLGRARAEAIPDLVRRLVVLHDRHPIERVVLGQGRLFI